MKTTSTIALLALLASGCAVQLAPGAERVRIVTASDKASCESLGVVSAERNLGPNKQGNAMNEMLNEVARRGGNALFVLTELAHFDGVGFTGEALRCGR